MFEVWTAVRHIVLDAAECGQAKQRLRALFVANATKQIEINQQTTGHCFVWKERDN